MVKRRTRPLAERLWAKVEQSDEQECWPWTGCLHRDGYGKIGVEGKTQYAHRVAYELTVGPIPDDLVIDHLCRNRACVNPRHMEPVTRGVNVLRGYNPAADEARRTRCIHGHLFDDTNTYWWRGHRTCRQCGRERARTYRLR